MRLALVAAMATASVITLAFAAPAPFDAQHPLVEGVTLYGAHHWGTIFIFKRRPSGGTVVSREEAESVARAMVRDHGGDCDLDTAVKDESTGEWKVGFSCRKPFVPAPPFVAPPEFVHTPPPEIMYFVGDGMKRDDVIYVREVSASGAAITAKEALRISQEFLNGEHNACTAVQVRHDQGEQAWIVPFRCKQPLGSNHTKQPN